MQNINTFHVTMGIILTLAKNEGYVTFLFTPRVKLGHVLNAAVFKTLSTRQ